MKHQVTIFFSFFVFPLIFSSSFLYAKEWKEVRINNEVIIVKESENCVKSGQIFAKKDKTTFLLIGDNLGKIGKIAAEDIQKYLPLASGCKVEIETENEINNNSNGFTILLATTKSTNLLNWLKIDYPKNLDGQKCLIKSIEKFPNGTKGVAIIGGSSRGLLNGVYTLLEKSANIWWEPVRVLNPKYPLYSNISETTLSHSDELRWQGKTLMWQPVIKDRVIYLYYYIPNYYIPTKTSVDWASRNRLSHFVITTPENLPISKKEEKSLKSLVDYAHDRGLKVLFLNMTHRLPVTMSELPASSDEALKASTKLYANQFKRFDLDGMAWHIASERIHVNMDEAYKKEPRIEWEAKYFNSYYKAIRKIKKDAILVMLMGWAYMNPAEKLATLFPKDVISWVVPYTPIIDAALTDLDSYGSNFNNLWYWLYVGISRDGVFPTVKTDYLEKYFREAIKRGHGLAPQSVLYNNNENAMYFVLSARDGVIPNKDFLRSFGKRYYGDTRMGKVLIKYQDALVSHRNWYNNIHTVDINYFFNFQEKDYLKEVFETSLDVAKKAKTPLIKNRLKVLTITALRCIVRRSLSPKRLGKTWISELQQLYEAETKEFTKMIKEIKSVFTDSYFGKEKDFFWNELLKMERAFNEYK